ncbi:MAG TPA: hypothetical protein VLL76_02355, partial [Candidatus Omnitrophota bacterium]|nr:hypothetical protein [Candidatus Omnitrophota bacterium]
MAKKSAATDAAIQDVLLETTDNRGIALKVDRERGVIPGVKLLGAMSARGREYPREVMTKAMPLYEGRPVNVDHVDPGGRRSYRDRIGAIKNVTLKEDGLYGDFHYNPKHALAEQLAWDAENAPQNVGFSHDARGPSKLKGGRVVVESIDRVISVDLVANPATTQGLFEDRLHEGEIADKLDAATDGTTTPTTSMEESEMEWKDIDLDGLKKNRPDLATALQESLDGQSELKRLQEELTALKAEKAAHELQESIAGELKAAKLDPANAKHVSPAFLAALTAVDVAGRKALIEDRAEIVLRAAPPTDGGLGPKTAPPLQEGDGKGLSPLPPTATPFDKIRSWG